MSSESKLTDAVTEVHHCLLRWHNATADRAEAAYIVGLVRKSLSAQESAVDGAKLTDPNPNLREAPIGGVKYNPVTHELVIDGVRWAREGFSRLAGFIPGQRFEIVQRGDVLVVRTLPAPIDGAKAGETVNPPADQTAERSEETLRAMYAAVFTRAPAEKITWYDFAEAYAIAAKAAMSAGPAEWEAAGLTKAEWDRYLQQRKDYERAPSPSVETQRMREALAWFVDLHARPGESSNDHFERVGEAFRRDTSYLRPGKDCRIHDDDVRCNAWEKWKEDGIERARRALASSGAATEGAKS